MPKIFKVLILLVLMMLQVPKTSSSELKTSIIFRNYDLNNTLFMNRIAIQRIFTRQDKRWSNGDEILVYIKPMNSIEHKRFLSEVLHMTLYRYERSLSVNTQTGKALLVTEINSDDKMGAVISNTHGAIGYLNYTVKLNGKQVIVVCDDYSGCYD